MNWHRVVGTALIAGISVNLFGQTSIPFSRLSIIVPYKLEVTYNKTTNLVFPSAIISIDRGSTDILAEKAVGVDNILRVKADIKNFAETNLSVITKAGKLYSFLVNYNHNPAYLNINVDHAIIPASPGVPSTGLTVVPAINSHDRARYASAVVNVASNVRIKDRSAMVVLELNGFYVDGNVMFCRLKLDNSSMINYDIDQFRLYIKDKKQAKRTASQEIEIQPLSVAGDTVSVKAMAAQNIIIAVPKFTIPDGKFLFIEIMERNGGRHLALRIKNKHMLKARSL